MTITRTELAKKVEVLEKEVESLKKQVELLSKPKASKSAEEPEEISAEETSLEE